MDALGGRWNIREVDVCITRLRVTVKDLAKVNSDTLQSLGALGVVIFGYQVQAVFGKRSDNLKREMEERFGLNETGS
nr:glucose PTS transporter subunit EIIB [Sodalis glossinidius]